MNSPAPFHCRPQTLLETVDGETEIFLELVEIFQRESRTKLDAMKAAVAASDVPLLGRHSHSLKGTVGPLAADGLVRMLQQLEDDCRAGRCDGGAQQVAAIERELLCVAAEVQQFVAAM